MSLFHISIARHVVAWQWWCTASRYLGAPPAATGIHVPVIVLLRLGLGLGSGLGDMVRVGLGLGFELANPNRVTV